MQLLQEVSELGHFFTKNFETIVRDLMEPTKIMRLSKSFSECVESGLDPSAVIEYLYYGYVSSPRTIFNGIYRADHPVAYSDDIDRHDFDHVKVSQNIRNSLESYLSKYAFMYPNKLGLFLTSGLDSAALAALSSVKVETFCIGFSERFENENEYAKYIARSCGHSHNDIILDAKALQGSFQDWAETLEQPYSHPNAMPTWYSMRLIKSEVEAVMDGSGSDDNLSNMGQFNSSPLRQFVASANYKTILRYPGKLVPNELAVVAYQYLPKVLKKYVYSLTARESDRLIFFNFWKSFYLKYLIGNDLDQSRSLNLKSKLSPVYREYHKAWAYEAAMMRGRLCAKYAGIEVLMPFDEPEFSSFTQQLSLKSLERDGKTKYMLNDFIKEKVPGYVYKKRAMETPWRKMFCNPVWRHDLLNLPDLLPSIPSDRIKKTVELHLNGNMDHSHRLLNLLTLGFWLNAHDIELPDLSNK